MDPRFERIISGLGLLHQAWPDLERNSPLSEAEVHRFESNHRIELPEEYRGFLVHVGNGGAGPYTICRLGEFRELFDTRDWWNWLLGDLSEPFPHVESWNDHSGAPQRPPNATLEDEDEMEPLWEAWRKNYWRTSNMNGAIPICDTGCGHKLWLIVNGPERNHLWNDNRMGEQGIHPAILPGKNRVTFLEWYCDWMERELEKLKHT